MERLSFGFSNPNVAGAVFSIAISAIWYTHLLLSKCKAPRLFLTALLIIESLLLVAAGLTCSRAALSSWLVGIIILVPSSAYNGTLVFRQKFVFLSLRLIVFFSVILWTKSNERFGQILKNQDLSVVNRIESIPDSIRLMTFNSVGGWRHETTGQVFSNWFQSPTQTVNYAAITNSFIATAVYFGLIPFLILLYATLLPFTCVSEGGLLSKESRRHAIFISITTLIICINSALNPCLYNPLILIVLLASIAVIIRIIGKTRRPRIFILNGIYAIILTAALYASSAILNRGSKLIAAGNNSDGSITVINHTADQRTTKSLSIFLDYKLLGTYYGKPLRMALSQTKHPIKLRIFPPASTQPEEVDSRLVLLGARAPEIARFNFPNEYYIIFPVGHPPANHQAKVSNKKLTVFIPEYDELGHASAWGYWAERMGGRVLKITGSGQQLKTADLLSIIDEILDPIP